MKLEALAVGITVGSREVPGRSACDRDIHNNNNNNNIYLLQLVCYPVAVVNLHVILKSDYT